MAVLFNQSVFSGVSGAVTTSAGLATTYTGLCLTNPINSRVELVLQSVSFAELAAQTTALVLGLMSGFSTTTAVTQTTPATVVNNFIGSPVGFGLLATAATIVGTPVLTLQLDGLPIAAAINDMYGGNFIDLNDGQPLIIIPPGGWVAFYTSAASVASSLSFGIQWGEQ